MKKLDYTLAGVFFILFGLLLGSSKATLEATLTIGMLVIFYVCYILAKTENL